MQIIGLLAALLCLIQVVELAALPNDGIDWDFFNSPPFKKPAAKDAHPELDEPAADVIRSSPGSGVAENLCRNKEYYITMVQTVKKVAIANKLIPGSDCAQIEGEFDRVCEQLRSGHSLNEIIEGCSPKIQPYLKNCAKSVIECVRNPAEEYDKNPVDAVLYSQICNVLQTMGRGGQLGAELLEHRHFYRQCLGSVALGLSKSKLIPLSVEQCNEQLDHLDGIIRGCKQGNFSPILNCLEKFNLTQYLPQICSHPAMAQFKTIFEGLATVNGVKNSVQSLTGLPGVGDLLHT